MGSIIWMIMIMMNIVMIVMIVMMIIMIVMILINMNNLPPVGAKKTGWRGKNRSGCNAADILVLINIGKVPLTQY